MYPVDLWSMGKMTAVHKRVSIRTLLALNILTFVIAIDLIAVLVFDLGTMS